MSDIMQTTMDAINSIRSEAMQAYDRLENIAALPFLSWFDFSSLPGFGPEEPRYVELGQSPKLEKASAPWLDALGPDTLDRYHTHVWQGTNLNALQTKIMEWIDNGGVGISSTVQQDIFNQGRERDLQTLRDEMDIAGARAGARGFRYANSMTRTLQNQAIQRYSDKKADLSREIVRTIADLAQKNVQFAFSQDVAIEGLHADFAVKFADLYRNINRDILDRFRVEQETRVAEFEGELKILGMDIEARLKNAEIGSLHQRQLLEAWTVNVGIITERGKAQIEQSKQANATKLAAARSLAAVYSSTIQNLTGSAISVVTKKA